MSLVFTKTTEMIPMKMIPNGVDIDVHCDGTSWDVAVTLKVTPSEALYNTSEYQMKEDEIAATAEGSLANKAGEGHNPSDKEDADKIFDCVKIISTYPWQGAGSVQWNIPYQILKKDTQVVVETGIVIQKVSIDNDGKVTISKGNFSEEMGTLPLDKK